MSSNVVNPLVIVVLAVGLPLTAAAEGTGTQARPAAPAPKVTATPAPRQPVGVRGFGEFGATWAGAAESFDLVFGGHRRQHWGGGLQVVNLWRGLFVQAGYSRTTWTGERVFVAGADVVRLGIPVNAEVSPLDVSVGWRVAGRPRAAGAGAARPRVPRRPAVYAGGGAGWIRYRESSPFAEPGDDVDESSTTTHVMGGVEVPVTRWLHMGVEGRYRFAPDLLGAGGVSARLGETQLGGAALAVRLAVGR